MYLIEIWVNKLANEMKIYLPQEVNMEFVSIQNSLIFTVCIVYIKWIDTNNFCILKYKLFHSCGFTSVYT